MRDELQAILDATMDVVVVFDSDRRFVRVNEAACRFYGRDCEGLLGARLDDFIGTERAEADWAGFLTPERIAQGTLENVWEGEQDGEPMVLEVRARPAFLPDRHLFVLRDITEQRRLEEQLRQAQKMEAVGQLAGGVAHDFNNLLTVISGYGRIARRRIGAGPGAGELEEIERAAERATELTRRLLAFARRQVLAPALLDLGEVVAGLSPMLARLIGENVAVEIVTGTELPPVLADRTQLEQVVVNLAINARDAMPDGGTLTIETASPGGDEVVLTVGDTGSGMPPEVLERIYEPFFTTKETGLGTGLGLAMVHGIVAQSQGRVEVESESGIGTVFSIRLPAAPGVATIRDSPPVPEPEPRAATGTVLLCEDEGSVRRLLELLLVSEGYTVLEAARPADALQLATRHGAAIDVLLTDIVMPEMSGLDLARRLQGELPGLRTLFVSGYSPDAIAGGLPADCAFLEKPISRAALVSTLRELLAARV